MIKPLMPRPHPDERVVYAKTANKLRILISLTVCALAAIALTAAQAHAADNLLYSDKSFLTNVAESRNAEVNASQLALQKK
ncbi:hypothetical protein [Glaciimonas sp. PCH181]|uniref:hypothetical protein n=1 Tax=Glaciimonas sp. PCH181 TaxID=2133943 RepID=UPI000D36A3E2|nr:hypothetical protein [Glaciimonas sp. PCH181]PUA16958.1 hypothetical protein C7W93_13370 [Glaciimonas sp. PCH181]